MKPEIVEMLKNDPQFQLMILGKRVSDVERAKRVKGVWGRGRLVKLLAVVEEPKLIKTREWWG